MGLPRSVKYLVIGAGVHGLSTAWHLAKEQHARRRGARRADRRQDRRRRRCLRHRLRRRPQQLLPAGDVRADGGERRGVGADPAAFSYHAVGYMALGAASQSLDLTEVHERQQRIGYRSELIVGADEVRAHMRGIFPDWRAQGVEVCLHETRAATRTTWPRCAAWPARPARPAHGSSTASSVTGFEIDGAGAVTRCTPTRATIAVEQVVVGVGPWIASIWEMLGLPIASTCARPLARCTATSTCGRTGICRRARSRSIPSCSRCPTARCRRCCTSTPTRRSTTTTASSITDELWGNYFKQDLHGVQGGAAPLIVGHEFDVDPYPTANVESSFADMWCASLSHCIERFEGKRGTYANVRSGGVGASRPTTSRCSTTCGRTCT